MKYRERFVEVCRRDGWDAALEFLKAIFYDPAIQRAKGAPTDFLSDRDDDKVTAAKGFDDIVEGFKPTETVAERVAFLVECLDSDRAEHEARHPFQPFNALTFVMSDYERCSVVVNSMHAPADGVLVSQFGLNHELVRDEDSHEEYTFTYDLGFHPDQYRFFFDGEPVSGPLLHHDLKLVVFARWLVQLVGKLVQNPTFAAFPKTLPFRFVMVGSTGYGKRPAMSAELVPPITEATLAGSPQLEAWLEAAIITGDTGTDARFLFLAPLFDQLDSPDRAQLVRLVSAEPHLRALVQQLAVMQVSPSHENPAEDDDTPPTELIDKARRVMRGGAVPFARMLRAIDDPTAHAHETKVLTRPLPALSPDDCDVRWKVIDTYLTVRWALWATLPPDARQAHADTWETTHVALHDAAKSEPLLALMLMERELAPMIDRDGEIASSDETSDDREATDDWPGAWLAEETESLPGFIKAMCSAPPPGYVDAMIAALRRMGPKLPRYGGIWDWLYPRVLALGPRLMPGIEAVTAWATAWSTPTPGVYFDDRMPGYFGKILMAMGVEDVPDFVHAAHKHNEFMVEDFYPKWASRVPTRRTARFVEEFTAHPEAFDDPAAWEAVIYDSEPGLKMFVHAMLGTTKQAASVDRDAAIARLITASKHAGPRLAKVAYLVAEHLEDDDVWSHVLAILEALPEVDAEHAKLHRRARIVDAFLAVDGTATDSRDRVARLRGRYPNDALVMMLEARHVLETAGPSEGAQLAKTALRELSADDLVYRKAVFEYGGAPIGQWDQLEAGTMYAFLRITLDRFRDDAYRAGVLSGGRCLEDDPFYEAFEEVISQWTPAQRAEAIAGWHAELVFASESRAMPDEVVCQHVDPKRWQISWVIAQRLAARPGSEPWRIGTLLDVWGHFADDEDRRMALAKLVWPVEAWRAQFVTDDRVHPHLAWFIDRYRGISAVDLARQVFALLRAAGKPERVIETSAHLEDQVIVGVCLSVVGAYQATGDVAGAIAMLTRIAGTTSPKQPSYVLIQANIAALQMMAGDASAAEATLDALFAKDWSRFDYTADAKDTFAEKVLGGDLNAKYASEFRTYFASARFNAACLYAQTRRPDQAFAMLEDALRLNAAGYSQTKLVAESDFAPLHDDVRWPILIGGVA